MAGVSTTEIERRFLLASDDWRAEVTSAALIEQVYVAVNNVCQVRIRRYGKAAFITVKGARTGLSRIEIETPVAPEFADAVMAAGLCVTLPLVKTRHLVPLDGFTFEIDEYSGANAGLIVAEIELPTADADFPRPAWLGREVTADLRYRNLYLTQHPYQEWAP